MIDWRDAIDLADLADLVDLFDFIDLVDLADLIDLRIWPIRLIRSMCLIRAIHLILHTHPSFSTVSLAALPNSEFGFARSSIRNKEIIIF